MNVYDFDGTIYDGDSTVDFFLFVLKKKPSLLLNVPRQAFGFVLYGLKQIEKTQLKEYLADKTAVLVPKHSGHSISIKFFPGIWRSNRPMILLSQLPRSSC